VRPAAKAVPAAKAGRVVYAFGGGKADGNAGMKNLLGGKGANLAEMTRLGLPVPPGLIITTAACNAFLAAGGLLSLLVVVQVSLGHDPEGRTRAVQEAMAAGRLPGGLESLTDDLREQLQLPAPRAALALPRRRCLKPLGLHA
jgi:phosphoenolpyruvate synthase/pyruvate phosphate dikinase